LERRANLELIVRTYLFTRSACCGQAGLDLKVSSSYVWISRVELPPQPRRWWASVAADTTATSTDLERPNCKVHLGRETFPLGTPRDVRLEPGIQLFSLTCPNGSSLHGQGNVPAIESSATVTTVLNLTIYDESGPVHR
jgi:hypothetical protein